MKKVAFILIGFLTVIFMVSPSSAFVDVETSTYDELWEMFGPHIDRIFVKMYISTSEMWTALNNSQIDVTDWRLDKTWYDNLASNPKVARIPYPIPSDKGYFEIIINQNNESTLGPPGPADPNPKYPNPAADVWFRRACAYLLNRTYLEYNVLQNFGMVMYTEIIPYMRGWLHTGIMPGGLLENLTYPYNTTRALEILDEHHFPIDPASGWRYPDFNENGVKDPGEVWDSDNSLDFYVRMDSLRKMAGEHLANNLQNIAKIPVQVMYSTSEPIIQIIVEKRFHMYTSGWIFIGPEPDYLYDLHHSSMYWHNPELYPPNYQRINDTILDEYLEGIKFGKEIHGPDFNYPTYPTPITKYVNSSAWAAQERMCEMVHDIPLFTNYGAKAMHKTYTETGKPYAGKKWHGIANEQGFGINSRLTFLNGYPEGFIYGTGVPSEEMVMQYGWSHNTLPASLNILYADWYWDFEVLLKIYDSLAVRNPYDLSQVVPWMINCYKKCTFTYYGKTCTKVLISLKSGIKWFDGESVTTNDVAFSLIEVTELLLDKSYSPPWWYYYAQNILDYKVIDPLTIEILLNTETAWATYQILVAPPIIPEHVWRPIIETGDPTAFQPDPDMIGSGPFQFVSLTVGEALEMEANKEYLRFSPIMPEFNTSWVDHTTISYPKCRADPGYPQTWTMVTIDYKVRNNWLNWTALDTVGGYLVCDVYIYVDGQLDVAYFDETMPCGESVTFTRTYNLSKCSHEAKIAVHIKGPAEILPGLANPWVCSWQNATLPLWVTIKYDIAGAKYLDKVIAPDCRVEGKDNGYVAKAYNTVPGQPRWNALCDVNDDYKIEGKDIGWMSKFYDRW